MPNTFESKCNQFTKENLPWGRFSLVNWLHFDSKSTEFCSKSNSSGWAPCKQQAITWISSDPAYLYHTLPWCINVNFWYNIFHYSHLTSIYKGQIHCSLMMAYERFWSTLGQMMAWCAPSWCLSQVDVSLKGCSGIHMTRVVSQKMLWTKLCLKILHLKLKSCCSVTIKLMYIICVMLWCYGGIWHHWFRYKLVYETQSVEYFKKKSIWMIIRCGLNLLRTKWVKPCVGVVDIFQKILASPDHQQPLVWIYKIKNSFSSIWRYFNYLPSYCQKIIEILYYFMSPKTIQHIKSELISPWSKWLPFPRRHFQHFFFMYFHEWKILFFDLNFIEVCS